MHHTPLSKRDLAGIFAELRSELANVHKHLDEVNAELTAALRTSSTQPGYIDRSDAVNLARNLVESGTLATAEGMMILCDAVLRMDAYITTVSHNPLKTTTTWVHLTEEEITDTMSRVLKRGGAIAAGRAVVNQFIAKNSGGEQ